MDVWGLGIVKQWDSETVRQWDSETVGKPMAENRQPMADLLTAL